jgi:hypothetical protein
VLTAYAAQSHPNCRPSDRIATMPSTPLAVSPEHANQNNRSASSYIDASWNEGRSACISRAGDRRFTRSRGSNY